MSRHAPGTRDFDPALYRVSHHEHDGVHVTDPLPWDLVEAEFRAACNHIGWYAPKVWTEGQWAARQAALDAGKAAVS